MGLVGQTAVTAIDGAVRMGHVVLAVLLTTTPQILCPVAVEVLVLAQLVGAT
jgi:hypothetical protein